MLSGCEFKKTSLASVTVVNSVSGDYASSRRIIPVAPHRCPSIQRHWCPADGRALYVCAEHDRQLCRWKSFIQPDGGEGVAKRKGVVARWGLQGSVEQSRSLMDKNAVRRSGIPISGTFSVAPKGRASLECNAEKKIHL